MINSPERAPGPFDLRDDEAYRHWRDDKLAGYPALPEDFMVEIADLGRPSRPEAEAIKAMCDRANMAIYVCRDGDGDTERVRRNVRSFASAFGLSHVEDHRSAADDGIVLLEVSSDEGRKSYIPYTTRPLNWHTDGYYNQPSARIRSFVMHCVRDASTGGENGFLDPEIAYIRLRDHAPDLVAALMHPDAMTIPSNVEENGAVRPASRGPVFSVDPLNGALHMRYSARTRNIIWRDDDDTRAAAGFLIALLKSGGGVITHRLSPGQGIICNNVLHNRAGFENGPRQANHRLYLRARYQGRVGGA